MPNEMDVCGWLNQLNAEQREAVTLPLDQHGAILAGAGTGKTRVLIHRIAYSILQGIGPETIVAVTFTNKAASEMRQRIESLVGEQAKLLRLGTFHSLGLKLLRRYGHYVGLERCEKLAPMDEDEAVALLRRVMKTQYPEVDLKIEKPKDHYFVISQWKDQGLYVSDVPRQNTDSMELSRRLYAAYESEKTRSQVVDFSDLILQSNLIFRQQKQVADIFHRNLRMVLVDEFQDTNPIQIEFIDHLTGHGRSVPTFVVGDDDQSIYGWRGADASIMQNFLVTYAPNHLVRLEQNYRCTSTVLEAANAVIANNADRIGKNLWTSRQDIGAFDFRVYRDAETEAGAIADQIMSLRLQGVHLTDIVVLYRKNMMSRAIEKGLVFRDIPYRIYGGLNFFQRREIKDALSWLRVVQDPMDEAGLLRALNTPKRGVGSKTLDQWQAASKREGVSLWSVIQRSQKGPVRDFVQIIHRLRSIYEASGLVDLVRKMIEISGVEHHYLTTAKERGEECAENLHELVLAASVFHHQLRAAGLNADSVAAVPGDPLSEFLADAVLNSDQGHGQSKSKDNVSLMTVHRAKGLEFKYVFMIGLEDGEFPKVSTRGHCNLEEERRLFYVGVTRSKHSLFLSCAQNRQSFDSPQEDGDSSGRFVSRFVQEIPPHLLGDSAILVHSNRISMPSYHRPEKGLAKDWW